MPFAVLDEELSADGTDADKERRDSPRRLALTVLKNRFGKTGENIPLDYEPEKEIFLDAANKPARTGRNVIRWRMNRAKW